MSQYFKIRPQQEIRLKKWPPGVVNQLRLFVGHLEGAVNTALAAQVQQTPKRKFSEFVPVIPVQDISGEVEYREIRVRFEPPRGLRHFLFYEYQISGSSKFFNFREYSSPEPFFVFTDLLDAATYFIRIRVVTTDGLVGPWSDNLEGTTPAAKAQGFTQQIEYKFLLEYKTPTQQYVEGFQDIYFFYVEPIGGQAYYSIEYEATIVTGNSTTKNYDHADIEFRWAINQAGAQGEHDQAGQNMGVTVYGVHNATAVPTDDLNVTTAASSPAVLTVTGPFATTKRGTLMQKLTSLDITTFGTLIKLQARLLPSTIHPLPEDYVPTAGSAVVYPDQANGPSVVIRLKNFNFFEVNPSATS